MSTQPSALSALKNRLVSLQRTIEANTSKYNQYQRIADSHKKVVDDSVAEINSINAALELLEAANDYGLMTTGQGQEANQ